MRKANKRAGGDGGMTVLFHAERIRPDAPQHGRQRLDCDPLDLVQGNSVSGAVVKLGGTLCAFTAALSRPLRDSGLIMSNTQS